MPLSDEKCAYEARLNGLLDKYHRVFFCQMDNVRSQQAHNVRRGLRGKGELIMGKKTMQKKIFKKRAEGEHATEMDKKFLAEIQSNSLLSGNIGMLFTNEDISTISAVLDTNRVQAPARVGIVAPCDVIVPAGNTGLEPTMTSFFQALNIATKISKGTVEICNDKKVLALGEKVDNSVAALLQKLKISPFWYQVEIKAMYEAGAVFTAEDLKVTDATLMEAMVSGIQNIGALSLGAGIPTEIAFPHLVTDAFKTLLALSVETTYEFTEHNGKSLRTQAKEGKLAGAAAPAAPAAAPAAEPAAEKKEKGGKAPAKKEPEPEPEDDVGLGGLF